eukprot:TRINITY_DN171_c0_g1_i1.p1 TRINITY_DN171_c0_g1~~TRINITY_DN171_c0_g1_i1.p1  ORF type:complete len:396 (+),score=115.80 TRINITY_DN171_c0_g1_i1:47-1189(+)
MPSEAAVRAGDCPVCLELLLNGHDTLSTTPCGHCFHHVCVLRTLQFRLRCPICEAPLKPEQLHTAAPTYFRRDAPEAEQLGDEDHAAAPVAALRHELRRERMLAEEMQRDLQRAQAEAAAATQAAEVMRCQMLKVQQANKEIALTAAQHWDMRAEAERLLSKEQETSAQLTEQLRGFTSAQTVITASQGGCWKSIERDVLSATDAGKVELIRQQDSLIRDLRGSVVALRSECAGLTAKLAAHKQRAAERPQTRVARELQPDEAHQLRTASARVERRVFRLAEAVGAPPSTAAEPTPAASPTPSAAADAPPAAGGTVADARAPADGLSAPRAKAGQGRRGLSLVGPNSHSLLQAAKYKPPVRQSTLQCHRVLRAGEQLKLS